MTTKEVVGILRDTKCDDPLECIFYLHDWDEKYNSICKATDPPCDPWQTEGCPFCKQLADLIEEKESARMDFWEILVEKVLPIMGGVCLLLMIAVLIRLLVI